MSASMPTRYTRSEKAPEDYVARRKSPIIELEHSCEL